MKVYYLIWTPYDGEPIVLKTAMTQTQCRQIWREFIAIYSRRNGILELARVIQTQTCQRAA